MTLKKHNAGVQCTAIKNMPPMASIYAFHFHLAFNFGLCTLKMLQLLRDSVPRPPAGTSPLDLTAE